ncbi:MAG: phosphotransferase [Chloroflexota bacterium]|nr:phosphotransferase [Chloroflexota bacterium]
MHIRRLTHGGWHVNHWLDIAGTRGAVHSVVLRQWARPGWDIEDPDFNASREMAIYRLLSGTDLPVPRLLAADPDGTTCGVASILITALPGQHPSERSIDRETYLRQLAAALSSVHAVDFAQQPIPPYRPYHDFQAAEPSAALAEQDLWQRVIERAAHRVPPGRSCFIHRDFHPENTLWLDGRLTGIVDWTAASIGSPAVDVAHMRWNLALAFGADTADAFQRAYVERVGGTYPDQRHWDLVTLADIVAERGFDPSPPEHGRLARYAQDLLGVSPK